MEVYSSSSEVSHALKEARLDYNRRLKDFPSFRLRADAASNLR